MSKEKQRICKFCNNDYSPVLGNVFSSHVAHCTLNPKGGLRKQKAKENYLKHLDLTLGAIKDHPRVCSKCGNVFNVHCRESQLKDPKIARKNCTSACSHSRTLKSETIQRITSATNAYYIGKGVSRTLLPGVVCPGCGRIFSSKRKNSRFCSKTCSQLSNICKAKEATMSFSYEKRSTIQKGSYANGRKVAGGTAKWYLYKGNIKVQGSYEIRTCIILDKLIELGEYSSWEYTKDRIPYIGTDGEKHSYLLDFKVFRKDGTFFYIEIKGFVRENDHLKWEAVHNTNNELKVWFKKDLLQEEIKLGILPKEYLAYL